MISAYRDHAANERTFLAWIRTGIAVIAFGVVIEKLNLLRSAIPAVTHVDYSARIQTVRRETNPLYYEIIDAFRRLTGCPLIVNTSFNVRGEPIVCTPEGSYRCFMRTEMDYLVLETCVLDKKEQPAFKDDQDWRSQFALD